MLIRETVAPRRRRTLLRLALLGTLAGAIAAPMFQLGARAAAVPLAEVIVVHHEAEQQPEPPVPPIECGAAQVRSTVSRAVVDRWVVDGASLVTAARVVPSITHGAPSGFKLYAIRPGSPPAIIGLQNGDTLLRLNGVDVSSIESLTAALAAWAKDAHIAVLDLRRRGCPVTLTVIAA